MRELLCPLCPMMVPGQVLRLIQHDQLCAARGYDLGDIPHRQDPQDVRIVPPRKPHHLCRTVDEESAADRDELLNCSCEVI